MEKERTIPTVSADNGWNWGWECWSEGGTLLERHKAARMSLPDEWEEICDRVNDFLCQVEGEVFNLLTEEDAKGFLYTVSDDIWSSYAKGGDIREILDGAAAAFYMPPFQAPAEVQYD